MGEQVTKGTPTALRCPPSGDLRRRPGSEVTAATMWMKGIRGITIGRSRPSGRSSTAASNRGGALLAGRVAGRTRQWRMGVPCKARR